ncbi:hypothetical protein HanXRQr2_Chr11g0517601 [Helianthus annuus]|uniref:DUF4283 domain-containing protein n=1 Tax=Helianthus annuus TaxID=4232 RepID=A0A9K3HTX9_HELAN|nr:hypothetical protein HanXRQr2_Chr11g0517601 [Helianthus annuus]KAJ0503478.1 hypothetical protein HanHA300_Chr11g0424671 [Helianthus annuus]KAJ0519433.1 hypothetical protein HanHA89_Chr11g0448701 [Helianthus annuus]KAJ0691221.1 hypothetical protein HanOQP8_Chr11g0426651 [Helianthus annuus]
MVERSVVVPDRTSAFKGFSGSAVIGRTVDLETLVDFDKLLRIAKVDFLRIQYVGGLTILLSFLDEAAAGRFLEARHIWGPWFVKLELWAGQTLPLERVAWIKMHGIPLNLMEVDVFSQVGELFGKVLFVPKDVEEDHDLSVVKIGVLMGDARRCNEMVSLRWKDRIFRIWVDEELEDWVPDCLDCKSVGNSESESAMASSPVVGVVNSGEEEFVGSQKSEGSELEELRKSLFNVGNHPEVNPPMQMHAENCEYSNIDGAAADPTKLNQNVGNSSDSVGPFDFACGSGPFPFGHGVTDGPLKSRAHIRKPQLGLRSRKGKAQMGQGNSPGDIRPLKRSRTEVEEQEEGFGFVGFTSKNPYATENGRAIEDKFVEDLDLNAEANQGNVDGGG